MIKLSPEVEEALTNGYMLRISRSPSGRNNFASFVDPKTKVVVGASVTAPTIGEAVGGATESLFKALSVL